MTIPWMYLDKETASVNALKDYASMEHIINNYSDDLKESNEFLISLQSPTLSEDYGKTAGNPASYERRMADSIDRIDVVRERYQKAMAYMRWFNPAWAALSDGERYVLESFFLSENVSRTELVQRLCDELHCEKSSVYRAKDKALKRLALLLYGK